MAEFSKLVITKKGQALIAKVLAGTAKDVDFTKIATSKATYQVGELEGLTALPDIMQEAGISRKTRTNAVAVKLETAFSNTGLTVGYSMNTLGLFAADPEEGEILYAAAVETSGNCYMPAYNGITVSGAYITLITTVGNAENVNLEVNPGAVATIGDITDLQKQIHNLSAALSNKAALSAQETVELTAVPARRVTLAASELQAHINAMPRLLTEDLELTVTGELSTAVVLRNFYGPGFIRIYGNGQFILKNTMRVDNCAVQILVHSVEFQAQEDMNADMGLLEAIGSRYVYAANCGFTGVTDVSSAGPQAVRARLEGVLRLRTVRVKNLYGVAYVDIGGRLIVDELNGDSPSEFTGNSIGVHVGRGGIAIFGYGNSDTLGGTTNRNNGGLIINNGKVL